MTLLDLVKDSRMQESQDEWWKKFASIADKHPYNIPLEMHQQGHKGQSMSQQAINIGLLVPLLLLGFEQQLDSDLPKKAYPVRRNEPFIN